MLISIPFFCSPLTAQENTRTKQLKIAKLISVCKATRAHNDSLTIMYKECGITLTKAHLHIQEDGKLIDAQHELIVKINEDYKRQQTIIYNQAKELKKLKNVTYALGGASIILLLITLL